MPGPIEVAQSFGVFEDIFYPKEEAFAFLGNVLKEVIDLFPGSTSTSAATRPPRHAGRRTRTALFRFVD